MNDKITELYKLLNESKDFSGVFQTEDEVRSVIDDPAKVQDFYNLINESEDFKGVFKDVNEFTNTFQVKKKEDSIPNLLENVLLAQKDMSVGNKVSQTPSVESGTRPQPLPSTEQSQVPQKKDTGSYLGDVFERMGAGALDWVTSGAKQANFARKLLNIPKDIVKKELGFLGVGDDTAEKISSAMPFLKPPMIDEGLTLSNEVWNKIEKTDEFKAIEGKKTELQESSARYDQSIEQLIKQKDYKKAIGASFLAASESLPLTLTAMFGGPVGLSAIGMYSASTQYDQLSTNTDMNEAQKIANALVNGGLEIATEKLGSANYGKLIKSLYKTVGKEQAEQAVKGGLKNWFKQMFKRYGLYTAPLGEGIEELVNQFGGNITARATGEDPDRPLNFNLAESFFPGVAGGTTFTIMGAPAKVLQSFKPKKEDNAPPKPKEGEKVKEKKVTDMDYSLNGQEITKQEAEELINEAKDVNKLKGLRYKEDKALDSRIRDKFNIALEVSQEVVDQKKVEEATPAKVETKIEEESKDAEGIRGEVKKGVSTETPKLEQGTESGLPVGDTSQDGVEAVKGEEVKQNNFTYPKQQQMSAFDNISDVGNNSPLISAQEYISGLTGVIDNQNRKSKYFLTDKKINGKQVQVRVSDHTGNPNEFKDIYQISVIISDKYSDSVNVNNEGAEIVINANNKNIEDKLLELNNIFDNISEEVTPAKAQEPIQETPVSTELEHQQNIEQKLRDEFGKKGVPQEQIEGGIALLRARADAWAKEERGRTPEQYYQRISDIKGGEFVEQATPKLYQLPDGRQVMGINMPEVVNGFYSPIEKRLLEFKQEKASVNKWKEIIGKGDEATFTGVLDYLNGLKPDQTLSKAEINQFMKDNRIEVVEVVKGEEQVSEDKLKERQKYQQDKEKWINERANELYEEAKSEDESPSELGFYKDLAREQYYEEVTDPDQESIFLEDSENPTKFSQYQLPGSKENYKEVLVTLPAKVPSLKLPKFWEVQESNGIFSVIDASGDVRSEASTREDAIRKAQEGISEHRLKVPTGGEFTSSHFDEPNILVHLRMNTRTDADGKKVLFLEEIQSDWGQKGKKEGFTQGDLTADELEIVDFKILPGYSVLEGSIDLKAYTVKNKRTGQLSTQRAYTEEEAKNYELRDYNRNKIGKQLIPSAPFVTDTNAWVKLGLKTALREAIKQGVDRIAWSTGTQQFERWGSEKIDWVKIGDKGWKVNIHEQVEGTAFEGMNVDEEAMWEKGVTITSKDDLRVKIKKNLSRERNEAELDKLTDRIWGRMQTEDEGTSLPRKEGMESFYGSPQESKLGIVGNIAKSLFKQEPKTTRIASDVDAIEKSEITKVDDGYKLRYRLQGGFDGNEKFNSRTEAENRLKELNDKYSNNQHFISITPELKAEVEKGLPLFQKEGEKPKGAVETLADGKVVIHALESPDFSTLVHEVIHIFEKDLSGAEIASLEKWSGKKQGTREFSEAFARAGERYIYDGKAPTEQLKPIFEKFKAWMRAIYKTIKGSPIEKKLSPDVKKIFDKLLGAEVVEEQITPPKVKQLQQKETEVKAKIAQNLDDLMSTLGGIQQFTGEERAKVLNILADLIKNLAELTGLKGQQLYEKLKEELKGKNVPEDIVQEAWDKSEYAEQPKIPSGNASGLPSGKEQGEGGVSVSPKEATTKTESGEQKYRKTQINSLIQDRTLQQQEIAKIVTANKERYDVLHMGDAVNEARALIEDSGVESATADLIERTQDMKEFPKRNVARMILLNFYSKAIIDPNASEADKNTAYKNIDRLQSIIARENTSAGQGTAMMKIWKEMQPEGVLEFVKRKIRDGNDKVLKKEIERITIGQRLDDLYKTLTDESKKIIDDILAGKTITRAKEGIKPAKAKPQKKSVSKETVKREQDYRKNLLAQYKASNKTVNVSAIGLSKEQIELGGNLIASYIREGYYRSYIIADKLINDFKSIGVKLSKDDAEGLLDTNKEPGKTYREYLTEIEAKTGVEKEIGERIDDIIREHWSKKDDLKRTLAQKLIDEAGLSEDDAKRLEKAVLEQFDKMILEKSEAQLTKLLGTSRLPVEKKKKGLVDKMVELLNMGALDSDLYRDLFAEKFKLAKLNQEQTAEILRLASNVQTASGRGWVERDATMRLAKYIYELYPQDRISEFMDTWTAMAYSNMLMGISTSLLNITSAGANMTYRPIKDITNLSKWLKLFKRGYKGDYDVYNPFGEMFYATMLHGSQIGANEALEVFKNGDLNNKYMEDVVRKGQFKVAPLERNKYGKAKRFKPIKVGNTNLDLNIFNLYKYAARNLAAQDKFLLSTSYEVQLARILRDKLKNNNLIGKKLTKEVISVLFGEKLDMKALDAQIEDDARLFKQMTGEEMTDTEKKIRKRELIHEQLPLTAEEKEEAEKLARSDIFTDDRYGSIASLANALGILANSSPTAGLILKPFIPFTKVVGNVAEFMLDHTPYYGLLRAHGMSISRIKRLWGDTKSAQMGEVGSRAYYEQMGRAWFGTLAFSIAMMMFLGRDDEDEIEISGGYNQEGFKKKGRENVLPPYSIRIGNTVIPYKNIPPLAVPLALIGNLNDAIKSGMNIQDITDRFTASMLLDAVINSVFMVKDMSFLDGIQRGTEIIADALSSDTKKFENIIEGMIKSYLGFLTRPLPQNNNAVQQIWKFFDPTSYSQSEIKGMLRYAGGIQHFVGKPVIDQLGDTVKSYPGETLLPYTHWLNIKGDDERWKFLAKYNAIPNKLYNRKMNIETETGIEPRKLEENEFLDYTLRTGKLFSEYLTEYMNDKEKVAKRAKESIELTPDKKITGVQEDIDKLWTKAKDNAEMELFRWGSVKEEMPEVWNIIKKYEAYKPYQTSKKTKDYNWTKEELYEYNNLVTLRYAQRIKNYLMRNPVKNDKFKERIDEAWQEAREYVTRKMESRLREKIKNTPK